MLSRIENLKQGDTKEILKKYKTVAVVGLSRDPSKDSYRVAEYLKENGYHIIPVNPFSNEILGEKAYRNLLEMPAEIKETIEIVDIFRPSEDVAPIVKQAIELRKKYGRPLVVWMQIGIINEEAADAAEKSGLTVVMDKCMMQEHQHFFAH